MDADQGGVQLKIDEDGVGVFHVLGAPQMIRQRFEGIGEAIVKLLKLLPDIVVGVVVAAPGKVEALVKQVNSHHPTSTGGKFPHVLFEGLLECYRRHRNAI